MKSQKPEANETYSKQILANCIRIIKALPMKKRKKEESL
jgi:hypothetical protein